MNSKRIRRRATDPKLREQIRELIFRFDSNVHRNIAYQDMPGECIGTPFTQTYEFGRVNADNQPEEPEEPEEDEPEFKDWELAGDCSFLHHNLMIRQMKEESGWNSGSEDEWGEEDELWCLDPGCENIKDDERDYLCKDCREACREACRESRRETRRESVIQRESFRELPRERHVNS